jgi:hypothetical protein
MSATHLTERIVANIHPDSLIRQKRTSDSRDIGSRHGMSFQMREEANGILPAPIWQLSCVSLWRAAGLLVARKATGVSQQLKNLGGGTYVRE